MVQVTERATIELRRLLSYHAALPRQGVRLRLDEAGSLKMGIDSPHLGDAVIRRDKSLILILDGPLSATLARRVLDFDLPAGKAKAEFSLSFAAAETK